MSWIECMFSLTMLVKGSKGGIQFIDLFFISYNIIDFGQQWFGFLVDGTKPVPKRMLTYLHLGHMEHISMKL